MNRIRLVAGVAFGLGVLIAGITAFWLLRDLPSLEDASIPRYLPSVRIEDRHGRLLYEVIPPEGGRHTVILLKQIPLPCLQATVATEDQHFYSHPGFDPMGVARALWLNLRSGQALSGGSTITQQVARNLLLGEEERQERSLRRKLREVWLAWGLTRRFTKDEILALYLNQTYYGGMAYGLEAAAQTFFGKSARQLDLAECALLAGLPQAPAAYNPFTHPEAAKARQRTVLRLMEENGYISAEQRRLAERQPLVFAEAPYPIEAPHFVMMVRAEIDRLFPPPTRHAYGGLVVRTTLDLDWQHLAEQAVRRHLETLQRSEDGLGHRVNNAALVALDVHNGEVLALVGSPDYFDRQHAGAINMALAPRQPGSAIKPFIYAAALDPKAPGGPWTAATMLLDVSTNFVIREGKAYRPENYDRLEHGPVSVRQALASSLNIPAVLTLEHVGLENFFTLARKVGLSTLQNPEAYDLSLALGGGEVRLLDLSAAYGTLANGGLRLEPQIILEVSSPDGRVLYTPPPTAARRALDERVAWLITDILSDDDARRIGFGVNTVLRLDRPAAVKTGTTSNFHDNWTVGYTPEVVVGVWVGNTSYEPMREVSGLTGAAPIWHQFLRAVMANRPPQEFRRPAGLVAVEVCVPSGHLPTPQCPTRRREWFIAGTQPQTTDSLYRLVTLDTATGLLANANTPAERRVTRLAWDLPPQAHAWARRQGVLLYADLLQQTSATSAALAAPAQGSETIWLTSPAQGALYRLSPLLDREAQRILLQVAGPTTLLQVVFRVDGAEVARRNAPPFQAWWPLTPGVHRVWAEAVLTDGQVVTSPVVTFTVLQE